MLPVLAGGTKLLGLSLPQASHLVQSVPVLGGLFKGKSPRYGGGDGPLYSTVNQFLARVATGETGVISELDRLRRSGDDKKQWQLLWDTDLLAQPMNAAQRALLVQLDPGKKSAVIQVAPATGGTVRPVAPKPAAPFAPPKAPAPGPTPPAALTPSPERLFVYGAIGVGVLLVVIAMKK